MPANLIHCQNCRALLNPDLDPDSVEIPAFFPLEEISTTVELAPRGWFVVCPHCQQELRVGKRYVGTRVKCKHCHAPLRVDLSDANLHVRAFYADCPHCSERLRASKQYLGQEVVCKSCQGRIHFVER